MIKYTVSSLGALPVILVNVVLAMGKHILTDKQINAALGAQYEEMKRLSELQLRELSILLAERSGRNEWEWFNVLRSARDMGYWDKYKPTEPTKKPDEDPASQDLTTWAIVGVVVVLALFVATR